MSSSDTVSESYLAEFVGRSMQALREEYTVMPRFGYHQPLDYDLTTLPPAFGPPIFVSDLELPLPPVATRMGYSDDDDYYLKWGKFDHDLVLERAAPFIPSGSKDISILDFGCSSGRVLRHFHSEQQTLNWKLYGVDVQAHPIEWMRQNFPKSFCVYTGNVIPTLPFEDNSIDIIYGFSVFTHIKYQWDAWILELRRVLKQGGVLLQTIHTENAWRFYYIHRAEQWVRDALPEKIWSTPEMDIPYLYHGHIGVSQVFWRSDVAREYWGRYINVIDLLPPATFNSFQDMIVCRK